MILKMISEEEWVDLGTWREEPLTKTSLWWQVPLFLTLRHAAISVSKTCCTGFLAVWNSTSHVWFGARVWQFSNGLAAQI